MLTEADMILIKDRCLEIYNEIKWGYKKPDERMILTYCYTKAVVDILKKKSLLSDIEVGELNAK